MSIKQKLYSSFGIIIVIMLGLSIFSVYQLTKINDDYTYVLNDRVYKVTETSKIQNAYSVQGMYIRSYVLRKEQIDIDKLMEQREIATSTLSKIENLFNDKNVKKEIENVKEQQKSYNEYVDSIIAYIDANKTDKAYNLLFNFAVPANESIQQSIDKVVEFQKEKMDASQKSSTSSAKISKIMLIVISAIASVVAIVLSVILQYHITNPIHKLTNAASVIANGDLRKEDIQVKTKDEIYQLANAFNSMKSSLKNLISNVSNNVSNTTAAAEQLAASTDEVSLASNDIAKHIETIAAGGTKAAQTGKDCAIGTEETAKGVNQIAEAAQNLHVQAIAMQEIATEGGDTLKTAEQQMSVIQQSSYETQQKIKKLSKQSAEIENITNVITDITDQTNLLALNAAIEAARAGEHGKGFAVVADEVRKLAEQSKQSATKIVGLTTLIQQDTKEVEKSVEVTVHNIDEGVMYVNNAQKAFTHINNAITTMTEQIQDTSASAEEISAITEEVAASVSNMADAATIAAKQSNTVLASVEEQNATMHEINSVAKSLNDGANAINEEISRFQI